ncbi:Peptidoglycan hydrolase FlgJ [Legionella massiliensis]|uniref:Peptidoglycan hydrolase FlgJ n=1 Tax=Legionella massiliensis TaxID=1034943 RepID=A0A078KYX6_9GAMM|nr:flagellar assembly peptidoglycan hydrolase FlgJ [Legionella massiliensis]CDZ78141.1 Peptidoglycan hydrolase FlgJ [Legionella massiliensis]CEE13879.1 Peptidoglycan hydrolase FlgJ [Legionella massiliensis]
MAIEGVAVSDFQSLQDLRVKAQRDPNKALPEVSKQFEAIFLQSMLKSMRMGQHFLDDSSPFKSQTEDTFREMLDAQYAEKIAKGKGIGLAAMLTKQLAKAEEAGATDSTVTNKKAVEQSLLASRIAPRQEPAPSKADSANVDDFVKSAWPYAQQAASLLGLDPKVLLAQAALETGWGHYVSKDADGSSSNNLFNIKSTAAAEGDSVQVKTTEYIANNAIKVNASFKKYPSIESSFNDYVSLIKNNERYGDALANTANPERYIDELHRAGYATDPQYASKILSIYHGDELQQALERNGFSVFPT